MAGVFEVSDVVCKVPASSNADLVDGHFYAASGDQLTSKDLSLDVPYCSDEKTDESGSSGDVPRDTWSGKLDFVLSAIGYAIGFGNIWRFPYLCYRNGGGAFLVPYMIMMVFLGMPLFYLELALGQYASLGPITVWRVCPLFKGLGYAMIGINMMVSTYYNVILALTILYLAASFTNNLPWADCDNWWNRACSKHYQMNTSDCEAVGFNATDGDDSGNVSTTTAFTDAYNSSNSSSQLCPSSNVSMQLPAEEYWQYYILGATNETSISNIGEVRWHMTLCLTLGWIVVFLCILKGVKSSGKFLSLPNSSLFPPRYYNKPSKQRQVVYITATFPYLIMVALFFRAVTLPGAINGIMFYLNPDFSRLTSIQVWNDAAVQILFTLGGGFGTLITMGSYNKFHNKCNRDPVVITLANCTTSFFLGFVIFSILGFMAELRHVPVEKVVDQGPGLAFIAYPEAVTMMPGAPFWSICFFVMLVTVGLDTQFVGLECIITGFVDEFSVLRRSKKSFKFLVCFTLFVIGIPCCTQGGMFVVQLMDKFSTSFPLLFVTVMEMIIITWIYGFRRFSANVKRMVGTEPSYYWVACWGVITPSIILFIVVMSVIQYKPTEYGGFQYPPWAEAAGWLLAAFLIGQVPLWAVVSVCQAIGSYEELRAIMCGRGTVRLSDLLQPDPQWGPALACNRQPMVELDADIGDTEEPADMDKVATDKCNPNEICNGTCNIEVKCQQ